MKKGKVCLFFVVIIFLLSVFSTASIKSRAAVEKTVYDEVEEKMIYRNITNNSVTIDWSESAKVWEQYIRVRPSSPIKGFTFTKMKVGCLDYDKSIPGKYEDRYTAVVEKSKSTQYTFNNLQAGRDYRICIRIIGDYAGGGETFTTYDEWNFIYQVPASFNKDYKISGVTATTAHLDLRAYVNQKEEEVKKQYSAGRVDNFGFGIAEVKNNNVESARAIARGIALSPSGRNDYKQIYNITFTKLKPGTSYIASVRFKYYVGSKRYIVDQIDTPVFKTATAKSVDDEANQKEASYVVKKDTSAISSAVDVGWRDNIIKAEAVGDEAKIKVKFLGYHGAVKAAKDNNKISIGYAKCVDYDSQTIQNYNEAAAAKMADACSITVTEAQAAAGNEFTFNVPGPGTYAVVMRCWFDSGRPVDKDKKYFYVCTKIVEVQRREYKKSTYYGYYGGEKLTEARDFDIVKIYRDNDTSAFLDWTDARNEFLKQNALKNNYGRYYHTDYVEICMHELPANASRDGTRKAYSNLSDRNQPFGRPVKVNIKRSKVRIYGLDKNKKYVFSIRQPFNYQTFGVEHTGWSYFYADETGPNYYNPKWKPVSGYRKTASDSSENSGSGSNGKSDTGSKKKVDSKKKVTNKIDAKFTQSKKTVKYKDLKKKKQKVYVKVTNSKGKVTVKNKTSKKLKKNIKLTVKGNKVTATLKKKAKKGTYKFTVTVAANGNAKKTTRTFKIVVK